MAEAKMTVAELEAFLHREFPQVFASGDIMIESADGGSALLRQHYSERMLRPGGIVSGPPLMALADYAMYVVVLSALGRSGSPSPPTSTSIFCAKACLAATSSRWRGS